MNLSSFFSRAVANSGNNDQMRDVIGNKADAAALDVGSTKSLMAYAKQSLMHGRRCVEKLDGAVLLGADFLFDVTGGPVIAKVVGIVTTAIGGASNALLQHTTTTPAVTSGLSTTVAIDNDAAGTSYRFVGATGVLTPVTNGAVIIDPVTVEDCSFLLPIGRLACNCSAARTGVISWYMTYIPLTPAAKVVAAA